MPVPGGHNQVGCVHATDFAYLARPNPLPSAAAAEAGCAHRRSSFAVQKRWNPEDQSGISQHHAEWGWALASQDLATRCSPFQNLSISCRHPLSDNSIMITCNCYIVVGQALRHAKQSSHTCAIQSRVGKDSDGFCSSIQTDLIIL